MTEIQNCFFTTLRYNSMRCKIPLKSTLNNILHLPLTHSKFKNVTSHLIWIEWYYLSHLDLYAKCPLGKKRTRTLNRQKDAMEKSVAVLVCISMVKKGIRASHNPGPPAAKCVTTQIQKWEAVSLTFVVPGPCVVCFKATEPGRRRQNRTGEQNYRTKCLPITTILLVVFWGSSVLTCKKHTL